MSAINRTTSKLGRPVLTALLVCDLMIREGATGKLSLINIFTNLYIPKLPALYHQFFIYVSLVDGHGEMPCRLQLTNLATGKILASVDGCLEFRDPLQVLELAFQLSEVVISDLGDHSVDFLVGKELLGSRRLRVELSPLCRQAPL